VGERIIAGTIIERFTFGRRAGAGGEGSVSSLIAYKPLVLRWIVRALARSACHRQRVRAKATAALEARADARAGGDIMPTIAALQAAGANVTAGHRRRAQRSRHRDGARRRMVCGAGAARAAAAGLTPASPRPFS
jgi:hypothetical protein